MAELEPVIPYLTVHDARAALEFYAEALGAVETLRVEMDTGIIGHASFSIGESTFYLSDEFAEMSVVSPQTLGGTTFAIFLDVADVDAAFAQAVDAGGVEVMAPADQVHGSRHGSFLDPFGHRWMLSQMIEEVGHDEVASRFAENDMTMTLGPGADES